LLGDHEDEVIASGIILRQDLQLLFIAVEEHYCKATVGY
jgi:hypothetical protein